jgi:hypothetical protein
MENSALAPRGIFTSRQRLFTHLANHQNTLQSGVKQLLHLTVTPVKPVVPENGNCNSNTYFTQPGKDRVLKKTDKRSLTPCNGRVLAVAAGG